MRVVSFLTCEVEERSIEHTPLDREVLALFLMVEELGMEGWSRDRVFPPTCVLADAATL